MKSIFICHTVYHVYIALLKNYTLNGSGIVLVDTIPNYKKLANKIKNLGYLRMLLQLIVICILKTVLLHF